MRQGQQGFTLVELILGLSLLSVVMLTLYSVFWGGIRLGYKTDASQEIYRQAYWTLDVMGKEIENLVKYTFSESYENKFCFVGQPHKITFMSATPEGLKAVSYFLISEDYGTLHKTIVNYKAYKKNVRVDIRHYEGEPAQILVRREVTFADYVSQTDDEEIETDDDLEVIAVGVKPEGLSFTYGSMGEAQEGEAANLTWLDEWQSNELPLSVNVKLDLIPPDEPEQIASFENEVLIPIEVWSRLR